MKKIVVIGSLNIDLVTYVSHLPLPGETISSSKFQIHPGGKGANQAAAAAKLGGDVTMLGKIGLDDYGTLLLHRLDGAGVKTSNVLRGDMTGMAFITVSGTGENTIVLVPGANHQMQCSDIEQSRKLIEESDIVIVQLEIPLDVVAYALKMAFNLNKQVILNPAPAVPLPKEFYQISDTMILNESELLLLTDMPTSSEGEVIAAAKRLQDWGINRVIVTLGSKGSYLINEKWQVHIPSVLVEAVDTTGAGDAYIAAFAVGLGKGMDDEKAAEFASRVAAFVVTREGAQSSFPTLQELESK